MQNVEPIHGSTSTVVTSGPTALLQPVPTATAIGMNEDCSAASPYAMWKPIVWKLPPST